MSDLPPPSSPPPAPEWQPVPTVPPPGEPWPGSPSPTGAPANRSGLAVAALALGVVGVVLCFLVVPSVLALVFGLVAASQARRLPGGPGLGMARAGWILGASGLLLGAGFITIAVLTGDEDSSSRQVAVEGDPVEGDPLNVEDLQVGDCLMLPSQDREVVRQLGQVPCDEAHEGEVYLVDELDNDRDYPGDDVVVSEVEDRCLGGFEAFVGESYQLSRYDIYYLYPRSITWLKDAGYVCIVFDPSGRLVTGSLRDVGV